MDEAINSLPLTLIILLVFRSVKRLNRCERPWYAPLGLRLRVASTASYRSTLATVYPPLVYPVLVNGCYIWGMIKS
eukprot:scaffold328083_cov18-Prasinocladus_malaysianus.AAC.1